MAMACMKYCVVRMGYVLERALVTLLYIILFTATKSIYSLCHCLEGINNALCYKLVRIVGPCAHTRVALDALLNEMLRDLPSRSPSLKQSKRRGGLFVVIPVDSLVDLTFKWHCIHVCMYICVCTHVYMYMYMKQTIILLLCNYTKKICVRI